MNDIKPCSTCKYRGHNLLLSIIGAHDLQRCYRPNRPINLVTGKPKEEFASINRSESFGCGYEGKSHSENNK